MLTNLDYVRLSRTREVPIAHPLCALIRELRQTAGLSLAQFEERHGIPGVVVGAYERGDRIPPLHKLENILDCFGYKLIAVPAGSEAVRRPTDMVAELRAIANQLESTAAQGDAAPAA